MPVRLVVTDGPHAGKSFEFDRPDTFVVGRSARAHLRLDKDDRYFSRVHFLIEVNPPQLRLTDLGSRNGTFVNGQRVASANLAPGDAIKAGHTILRVEAPVEETQPHAPHDVGQLLTAPALPMLPGFRTMKELGRGGMGVVYLAERLSDGMQVAVKTISPAPGVDPVHIHLFLREAEILRQLEHAHIVRFFEMGSTGSMLFFAMAYVPGTDAAKLLKEHGRLPIRTAVRIVSQALEGLEYAHDRRFVHRDVKPANLLIGAATGPRIVQLADFGLARTYQASHMSGLTAEGVVRGTPAFMPPEQILSFREAKPPSDLYATAATLYTLLTGKYVYDFQPGVPAFKLILEDEPVPIGDRTPDIPAKLAKVIHKGLARKPERRWASAADFRDALMAFAK